MEREALGSKQVSKFEKTSQSTPPPPEEWPPLSNCGNNNEKLVFLGLKQKSNNDFFVLQYGLIIAIFDRQYFSFKLQQGLSSCFSLQKSSKTNFMKNLNMTQHGYLRYRKKAHLHKMDCL